MAIQQQDANKGRVNITLDTGEGEGQCATELPFTCLVLGDFGHHAQAVNTPQCVRIDSGDVDKALRTIAPSLRLHCQDAKDKTQHHSIDLQFRALKDFHPDNILAQVPLLQDLLKKREQLIQLKIQLIENNALRENIGQLLMTQRAKGEHHA